MVVYSTSWLDHNRANDYWKLEDAAFMRSNSLNDSLLAKGLRLGKRVYRPKRAKIYNRVQRGLYYFEQCSKSQLASFCKQRGLLLQEAKPKKVEMVAALENADEEQIFGCFGNLPPELRAYIYELHFRSFGSLRGPGRPPVTQVSRVWRKESLPLFYKTCNFKLEFYNVAYPRLTAASSDPSRHIISYETGKLLRNTTCEFLNLLQRIEISGLDSNLYGRVVLSRKGQSPWSVEMPSRSGTSGEADDHQKMLNPTLYNEPRKYALQELEAMTANSAAERMSIARFITLLRGSADHEK